MSPFIVVIVESNGYVDYGNAQLDMVTIVMIYGTQHVWHMIDANLEWDMNNKLVISKLKDTR